jgi:hypothetical protein
MNKTNPTKNWGEHRRPPVVCMTLWFLCMSAHSDGQHCVLSFVFTFCVSLNGVRCNFHIKTMFISSLPTVVCRRVHKQLEGKTSGMIFFSYLTDFNYFPLERNCWKLLDTVRTGHLKGDIDDFSYFSLIFSYFVF